jgi:hypothetical protein
MASILDAPAEDTPPVSTTLSLSAPTRSLSGEPPSTVTIQHAYTGNWPIWALISVFTPFCHHVRLLDPARKHRKIGSVSAWNSDRWDEDDRDLEDSKLVRLSTSETFQLNYTFEAGPKADGLRGSDMRTLTAGQPFKIALGTQKWWWMYEDEMPASMTTTERSEMLKNRTPAEWTLDCVVQFEARA